MKARTILTIEVRQDSNGTLSRFTEAYDTIKLSPGYSQIIDKIDSLNEEYNKRISS